MQKYFWVDLGGTLQDEKTREPLPGAKEAIAYLSKIGFKIIGITNEGDCARTNPAAMMPWKSIPEAIQEQKKTLELFPEMESVYFCPTFDRVSYCYAVIRGQSQSILLPAIFEKYLLGEISCRKPGHGMLLLSTEGKEVDWSNSWMTGDKAKDQLCATSAGVNFIWATNFRSRFGGEQLEEPDYPTKMFQGFDQLLLDRA